MNQITDCTTIIGNISKDAEVRQAGTSVNYTISFQVAINQEWKDISGNVHQNVKWYQCTLWASEKNLRFASYFTKGSLIMVKGEVSCNAWINQAGELKSQLELRVDEWRVLRKKKPEEPKETNDFYPVFGC